MINLNKSLRAGALSQATLFFLFLLAMGSAIEEPSYAISEKDFDQTYQNQVVPYFNGGKEGRFLGKNNVEIAYSTFELKDEKGGLVILPGRGEPLHKYAELVYDLRELGFSVYLLEHRGQGESGEVDGCGVQYVRDYRDYLEDMDVFVRTVVNAKYHSKLFLLAHSMGGAIGTLYASQYSDVFNAIVLSSPMFDMNTPPFPKKMAYGLAQGMVKLGLGKLTGGKDKLQTTSSEVRRAMSARILEHYSGIDSEKISFGWVKNSLDAISEIQNKDLSRFPPVLMLQAGSDLHVPSEGQNAVFFRFPIGEKIEIQESFHEILMEQDVIRNRALKSVVDFLSTELKN